MTTVFQGGLASLPKEVMPYEELRFQRPHGFWDVSLSIADFHSFDGPVKIIFRKKKTHPKLGTAGWASSP